MTWYTPKRRFLICCIAAVLTLASAMILKRYAGGAGVFRRYVHHPIPKSVKGIRADRPWELSGHRYVMRFKISEVDLALILNSRRFKEVSGVKYKNGTVYWDEDASHEQGISVYPTGGLGPDWFNPGDWDDAKAYRIKERNTRYRQHIQLLMYNKELGEAYCVEYQEGY